MAVKYEIQGVARKDSVVVMGAPLSGKTTWVMSQVDKNKTLVISTDGNALPGSRIARVESWGDLMEAIEYFRFRDDMAVGVLDVLDDAVAFAEGKAQRLLGMSGKSDPKGGYSRFVNAVGELIKESVLRPLLMSGKQIYIVMHSVETPGGVSVPCFGSYSKDATDILNWVKGRCGKVIRCESYAGEFDVIVEAERVYEEPAKSEEPKTKKAQNKKGA